MKMLWVTRNVSSKNHFLLVLLLMEFLQQCGSIKDHCPGSCTCKWKGGKQTVECVERGLIMLPENVNVETQVLDVSNNNLQILPRETFARSGLTNLQRVFFKNCLIGQVDELAFSGLTNLVELDLSFNLLTSVPSKSFNGIPFLRDLNLANNPISKIDGNAFKATPGLIKLDLSNCEIQTIAPKAFDGIELLESLKLNGNKLSELRPTTVQNLQRLHGVELHDNPWNCDCRLRSVKEWIIQFNIPYSEPPICSGGPERVILKSFNDLSIDDFACKPEMLPVARYIEVLSGENASLTCRANAVPQAYMKWYWNGRLLVNNSGFSTYQRVVIYETGIQEKISTLVLLDAHKIDNSEFYCVAENRAGNAEANFTLLVAAKNGGLMEFLKGQLASLSAVLVILVLFILLILSILIMRLRTITLSETKTPGHIEVVAVANGPTHKSASNLSSPRQETSSFTDRKPSELNFCNPVQKPPRSIDSTYPTVHFNGVSDAPTPNYSSPSPSGNNPDLINDTKLQGNEDIFPEATKDCFVDDFTQRPPSGEYSRNADSLYPSGLWEHAEAEVHSRQQSSFCATQHYDDKTPIITDGSSTCGSTEELRYRALGANRGYPTDYGLPIVNPGLEVGITNSPSQVNFPANAKTLRVWQKGGVPVLPPVSALKRAFTSSRNSPDEGYQEGCGTDV
ncbi:hypothetical protein HHI36_011368 [Cryptolaemus montrouzieri]|uniref:Ig-like domain-containing protein n=1 Tax=Cryptolaemus montrouzieri TaxID=559131 RepID=A0ABD2MLH6_9CUCU